MPRLSGTARSVRAIFIPKPHAAMKDKLEAEYEVSIVKNHQ